MHKVRIQNAGAVKMKHNTTKAGKLRFDNGKPDSKQRFGVKEKKK